MSKILSDEELTALAAKMELRRQWLMSPAGRARRDEVMRQYMKKVYGGNKQSRNGVLSFGGCYDVFEQKEMDYLAWKQKDFKERGLTGDWL
jgi:hypothetical protein